MSEPVNTWSLSALQHLMHVCASTSSDFSWWTKTR